MKSTDFSRRRLMCLEHTLALILFLATERNENGYDIASQNYFRALSKKLGRDISPAKRQTVSTARGKIRWEAFARSRAADREAAFTREFPTPERENDAFRRYGSLFPMLGRNGPALRSLVVSAWWSARKGALDGTMQSVLNNNSSDLEPYRQAVG